MTIQEQINNVTADLNNDYAHEGMVSGLADRLARLVGECGTPLTGPAANSALRLAVLDNLQDFGLNGSIRRALLDGLPADQPAWTVRWDYETGREAEGMMDLAEAILGPGQWTRDGSCPAIGRAQFWPDDRTF